MKPFIHILHLEDDPADAELIQAKLESADLTCQITRVQTRDEFSQALRQSRYDVIFADYHLPDYDGMSALRLAQERCPETPFIFVSGVLGEDAAIEALTQGAIDYVLKHKLARLAPAVTRALHEAENRNERKRVEEVQRRLNRQLRIITDCNQALIRAEDEQTLLNDICRIICDEAGYRMAWVGYAERDDAHTVRPVAWAGVEEGYLATAQITWDKTERGRGPTGTAIRSGKITCIQDFTTAPQTAAWRENALQRGYHSNIALPVKDERTNTFGALTIYSTEINAFTPEEIRLLEELAGNLAFGITSLRIRAERKQAEEALWESSQMLKLVLDNMPAFVFWKDRNSVYLGCNNLFAAKAGFNSSEEIIGLTDLDTVWKREEAERYRADDRMVMETGVPKFNYEEAQYPPDGGVNWVRTSKVPLRNPQGDVIGVLGTYEDITERKRAEEELQHYREHLEELVAERTEALEQEILERTRVEQELHRAKDAALEAQCAAEAANQAKSVFLANMSHELRTPLNAILGFAQVIARSRSLSSDQQENLGIIRRSGEHLLTLINQVLDLSKIEAGRMTVHAKEFDLHRLVHDIQNMFALRAETKGLHLLVEQDERVPRYVCTDEVKLRQVLINLLNNAVKFTEEGGVAVRVRSPRFSGHEEEPAKAGTPNLYFEIEDSGPGIAPEEMEQVFEAFGQTKTGRQSQEGTGLGLPISRTFVQLMGGDMRVKSEVGHGTIFTFDIQCEVVDSVDNRQSSIVNRVVALEPGQPRYRILIVDDRWTNRQVVVKLLNPFASSTKAFSPELDEGSGQGFELREAANGQEAIDIWETWKPHLIWMDMRMPVLDGYEATKRIKSAIRNSQSDIQTAIIALTASSFEEEQAVVLHAGCDDYLRKPFREAELFELLSKHLGVRFVYEEEKQSTIDNRQSTIDKVLTPEMVAALPAEWLATLKQGAEEVDVEMLLEVIAHIRERNAALAAVLARLVEDFEYDEILATIQHKKKGGMPSKNMLDSNHWCDRLV